MSPVLKVLSGPSETPGHPRIARLRDEALDGFTSAKTAADTGATSVWLLFCDQHGIDPMLGLRQAVKEIALLHQLGVDRAGACNCPASRPRPLVVLPTSPVSAENQAT